MNISSLNLTALDPNETRKCKGAESMRLHGWHLDEISFNILSVSGSASAGFVLLRRLNSFVLGGMEKLSV